MRFFCPYRFFPMVNWAIFPFVYRLSYAIFWCVRWTRTSPRIVREFVSCQKYVNFFFVQNKWNRNFEVECHKIVIPLSTVTKGEKCTELLDFLGGLQPLGPMVKCDILPFSYAPTYSIFWDAQIFAYRDAGVSSILATNFAFLTPLLVRINQHIWYF